jgi:hypothetical protein
MSKCGVSLAELAPCEGGNLNEQALPQFLIQIAFVRPSREQLFQRICGAQVSFRQLLLWAPLRSSGWII